MSARDRILAAIRAARPAPLPPAEAIAAEAAALLDAPESVRDGDGIVTEYAYNDLKQTYSSERLGVTTYFDYDEDGNVVRTRKTASGMPDIASLHTRSIAVTSSGRPCALASQRRTTIGSLSSNFWLLARNASCLSPAMALTSAAQGSFTCPSQSAVPHCWRAGSSSPRTWPRTNLNPPQHL